MKMRAFDEDDLNASNTPRFQRSVSTMLSKLSPLPIRNVNLRYLEEDSPLKPQSNFGQEEEEDEEESDAEVKGANDPIPIDEDEIEIDDVLEDLKMRAEVKVEAVEDLSEDFVAKSFDSIEVGDVSKGDLGDFDLPSIFVSNFEPQGRIVF
jgi:hypothetical protein